MSQRCRQFDSKEAPGQVTVFVDKMLEYFGVVSLALFKETLNALARERRASAITVDSANDDLLMVRGKAGVSVARDSAHRRTC
jgi:hypothetical protein